MAGEGTRFSKDGYLLPKALVPVSGEPMIAAVIRDLPDADKWIFLVRTEHITNFSIDEVIKASVKEAIIITIDQTTEGQASTCMLAMPHVADDDEILIAACDNGFLFDHAAFTTLRTRPEVDSCYWTFTKDELLTASPTSWGWLKVAGDGETIEDISIKIPVSDTPYYDHAVVATFWFKRASDFKAAYDLMYEQNYRINGEFYVDSLPKFLTQQGKKSVIFDVDLYVGWGKPSDLYVYQREEFWYTMGRASSPLWQKYFAGRK
jgi:NDP-sugar pyrophosphorylase family protein